MAAYKIVDKESGDVLGKFSTNRSLTFGEAMKLAGFEWFSVEKAGYGDSDGWSNDNGMTIWDESVADIEADEE